MAEPRLFTVAEALAHFEAPRDAVEWAAPFDLDFAAAWSACPRASWVVYLAFTAHVPFAPILASVESAHALRRRDVPPFGGVLAELRADGIDVADPHDAGLEVLRELVTEPIFADEERWSFGYRDGFFEQAYFNATRELDEIEHMLVAKGGRTPSQARAELLGLLRAHVKVNDFMESYRTCVENGYAGLEINR
jgi:hypothetical protein